VNHATSAENFRSPIFGNSNGLAGGAFSPTARKSAGFFYKEL